MNNAQYSTKMLLLAVFFASFITGTTVVIENHTDLTLHVSQKDWTGTSAHMILPRQTHAIEAISAITCNIVEVVPLAPSRPERTKADLLASITITEMFLEGRRPGPVKFGSQGFGAPIGWRSKFIVEFMP